MFNQFQGNYGMYPQQGVQYNNQMPVAKMTQVLTPEQIKQLRTTSGQFSLQVDPSEILRSVCTHKENGKIAVIDNNDGTVTCTVCGARFKLVDWDVNQVQEVTNMFIDVLQSIKTYFLDIPENYVNEYFKMIPLLEKVPRFYELAFRNFKKYEQGNPYQQNNGMYGFNMLNAIAGPGMMNPAMNPAAMNPAMNPCGGGYPAASMGMGSMPMYQPSTGGSPFVSGGGYPNQQQQQQNPQQNQQQTQQHQNQQQGGGSGQTVQTTKMFNL